MTMLESLVEQSQAKTAEYSRLLSDSVGAVYELEEENEKLKRIAMCENEEVRQFSRIHYDAK
ncbi:MAG: hypothetical protein ACKPKO_65330, partial [Candidatus Fonsibacter sp.]